MRTFKPHFKHMLMLFICTSLFQVATQVNAELVETPEVAAHHAQDSIDWPGIYQGFTPCADCMGVKTELALNKNSYVLITQYIGKSVKEFVEKGKFTWDSKTKTIVLTARKSETTRMYLVGDNNSTLTQLDSNGNRITGELAHRYILRKNDISKTPAQHSTH